MSDGRSANRTITTTPRVTQSPEELRRWHEEMINDIIMDLITEHNHGELIAVNKGYE